MTEEPERYHIVKYGENEPEHEMSVSCFCKPSMCYVDLSGFAVYVHRERQELMQ